jgi:hypothetical protein
LFKWKLNCGHSTLDTKHNFGKKTPPHLLPLTHKKKERGGGYHRNNKNGFGRRPLHSMTGRLIGCMEILFLKFTATMFILES